MKEIKNKYLRVLISEIGAEVRAVINLVTGHNYMHDGNPDIWNGISPILFPAIGKSFADQFRYKNHIYHMVKHGFARNNSFTLLSHDIEQIKFSLSSSVTDGYPFNLELYITYKLYNKQLITEYEVVNLSNTDALFSLGAHPAFSCPFDESFKLEDYYLEFECEETLTEHFINSDGYFKHNTISKVAKSITLDEHTFDNDALVFSGFKSKYIDLIEANTKRKIRVSIDGFSYLGIWAKPGRPNFVCIEPWCGRADDDGYTDELALKDGVVTIAGNKNWIKSYSISFDY